MPSSPHPPAVRTEGLTKDYVLNEGPRLLLHHLTDRLTGRKRGRRLRALDGLTMELEQGKTLGVIGVNGAGKSTILRLIAGISRPTSGILEVNGTVASLLELGAGFEQRLTARENVLLNGMLIGIPRHRLLRELESILHWAGVEEQADAPLYTFSSGMAMRLGFAIAIRTGAEILLLDEVLAVGDASFQAKCMKTIEEFKRSGKTIVFVSHDMYDVGNVCDEVMLLNGGRLEARGEPHDVIQRYWSTLVQEASRATLVSGALRVDFVDGKLYLWSGPTPLTKGFCGYTSVRSFVRWHESDKGRWRVLERSPARVVVEGQSWGLPLRQRWTLELSEASLRWDVDLEALAPLRLERQQANVMLSEAYGRFAGPGGATGDLGWFRQAVSDDWEVVFSCPADAGPIDLTSSMPRFPAVRMECRLSEPTGELAVVNSDLTFRGRLLQYRRMDPCLLEPGAPRPLLRGTVTVGR